MAVSSRRRRWRWWICAPLLLPPLWLSYRELRASFITPKAVLVLGGDIQREKFAATFALTHPTLPVWISSGSNPEYTAWVFDTAGIAPDRLHLDRTAVDTVTNFTTLADTFKAQHIDAVYLITSDYHMPRARVIGEIVFASRGISIKPVPVSSPHTESFAKTLRDAARALLWITTGRTGAPASTDKASSGN
jgi:uncharacterized SAM-binding protein YcdF (DUF218 family)